MKGHLAAIHNKTGLSEAGAHYVIDGIADLPACIDDIQRRLSAGERP
ncbi:MAG: hypothetical protein ACYC6Y_20005 [Thermoguttaceae bacterium]